MFLRFLGRLIRLLGRPWRFWLAIFGGAISGLAFPRPNIWVFAFVSVALIILSIRGAGFWRSMGVGFVAGMGFYLSQIWWLSLYLGPVPWIALSVLEALIFAVGMSAISLVYNRVRVATRARWGALATAAAVAALWVSREWVSQHFVYGGFPWSSLAQTQSETFLSTYAYYGGQPAISFAVAFLSVLVLEALLHRKPEQVWPNVLAAVLVLAIPLLTVIPVGNERGSVVLGAVQGNANAGLFANPVPGSILLKHLNASQMLKQSKLYDKLQVVVWPENASDVNPLENTVAKQVITDYVDNDIKVPLIYGSVSSRGDKMFNTSYLWLPSRGVVDYYDKKRPVPFAEYVPDRDFWYPIAPDLIGLVTHGYTPGTRDGIFNTGGVKYGSLICFEIAIPELSRELVDQGAEVLLAQSNNSDFGRSDETYQQGALARLRAIETGRPVIYVSTVGVSAIYQPNGLVSNRLTPFEPGAFVARIPLTKSITPAVAIGWAPDISCAIASVALLGWATLSRRRKRDQ